MDKPGAKFYVVDLAKTLNIPELPKLIAEQTHTSLVLVHGYHHPGQELTTSAAYSEAVRPRENSKKGDFVLLELKVQTEIYHPEKLFNITLRLATAKKSDDHQHEMSLTFAPIPQNRRQVELVSMKAFGKDKIHVREKDMADMLTKEFATPRDPFDRSADLLLASLAQNAFIGIPQQEAFVAKFGEVVKTVKSARDWAMLGRTLLCETFTTGELIVNGVHEMNVAAIRKAFFGAPSAPKVL